MMNEQHGYAGRAMLGAAQAPQRESQVGAAIVRQESAIHDLLGVIDALEARLGAVLVPQPPRAVAGSEKLGRDASVPLAVTLEGHATLVNQVTSRVRDLIQRLEV